MIHVRTQSVPSSTHSNPEMFEPVIHISLVGLEDIAAFKTQILDRALNCADPQKTKTWVELSDGLEKFIRNADIAKL